MKISKKTIKTLLITLALIAAVLAFAACGGQENPGNGQENPGYVQTDAEGVKALMDSESDYVILDVRTEEEYAQQHIPGALLIPDYEIADQAETLLKDKEQLILVYCRSGNRSKGAAAELANMGYSNVVEFGGINDWPFEIE